MFTAKQLSVMINDIIRIHDKFPRNHKKAFRKFDRKTPYGVHPIFVAMLLLHESCLPEAFRVRGAKALLAHDLIEDTTAKLPKWCLEKDVESLVRELTFVKGQDPLIDIWKRSKEAILLKFYDVVDNLICVNVMNPSRVSQRRKYALKHLLWVETHYPCLEVVKIARGLLYNRFS